MAVAGFFAFVCFLATVEVSATGGRTGSSGGTSAETLSTTAGVTGSSRCTSGEMISTAAGISGTTGVSVWVSEFYSVYFISINAKAKFENSVINSFITFKLPVISSLSLSSGVAPSPELVFIIFFLPSLIFGFFLFFDFLAVGLTFAYLIRGSSSSEVLVPATEGASVPTVSSLKGQTGLTFESIVRSTFLITNRT